VIATIAVPSAGSYFEGHFPGRPILPGVAELALVFEALVLGTGRPAALREISFVRLRQLVFPGDRLELAARDLDAGRMRFDLKRADLLVANGELILGPPQLPVEAPAPGQASTRSVVQPPTMDALLPHRPPMCFVTSILAETSDGLTCAARIPAACPLVSAGSAPALAALEMAAQAAAAWEGLQRWRKGGDAAPRIGYLVALRTVAFFAERFPADRVLSTTVHLEAAAAPLTHYRVDVSLDDIPIVRGTIATFLGG
jgi:predicted hotdog family 3-hydroxylacyl-ACP dehydratase